MLGIYNSLFIGAFCFPEGKWAVQLQVKEEDTDEPNNKKTVEDYGGVETGEKSVKLGKDAEHEKGYLSEGAKFVDFSGTLAKILTTMTM